MNILKDKTLFVFGKTLSILGLIYVLYTLSVEFTLNEYINKILEIKSIVFSLFILNVFIYMLGVFAWYVLLLHYSKLKFKYATAFYYYAKTDIAKYLPGNIFHLVGRQMLATKLKLEQHEMLHTSVFYSYLISVATVLIITALSLFSPIISETIKFLLMLLILVIVIVSYRIYPSIKIHNKIKVTAILFLGYIFQSLVISILVLKQLPDANIEQLILLIIIYVFSTLIGFLTPGASGGLGVREGVFIALISYANINISNEVAVFSILFVRLSNIFTDILANIFTYFQRPQL